MVSWAGREVIGHTCGGGRELRNGFTWYWVHFRKLHRGTLRVASGVGVNWTEVDAVAVTR